MVWSGFMEMWGGRQPGIRVEADYSNVDIEFSSNGEIWYHFRAVPKYPGLEEMRVPIAIHVAGEISGDLSQTYNPTSENHMYLYVGCFWYGEYTPLFELRAFLNLTSPSETQKWADTFYRNVTPNTIQTVDLKATVGSFTTMGHYSGLLSGMIDPLIQIDPMAKVSWQGNEVPYTELFSLEFSSGFFPASKLPEGVADFNGDGSTDVAALHLPSDQFFTDYTGNMGQYGWGGGDCYPIIWDYDGDGKTDISIYHIPTNQWFVKGVPGDNLGQFGWGGDESIPIPGDYNGDGMPERAFYHWPTNQWFVEGQEAVQFGYGGAASIPIAFDYEGDGKTDKMIYHVDSNQWFVHGIGELGQFGWGGANCIPVPADWNGDGKVEIGIVYVPDNEWIWRDSLGMLILWASMDGADTPVSRCQEITTEMR